MRHAALISWKRRSLLYFQFQPNFKLTSYGKICKRRISQRRREAGGCRITAGSGGMSRGSGLSFSTLPLLRPHPALGMALNWTVFVFTYSLGTCTGQTNSFLVGSTFIGLLNNPTVCVHEVRGSNPDTFCFSRSLNSSLFCSEFWHEGLVGTMLGSRLG